MKQIYSSYLDKMIDLKNVEYGIKYLTSSKIKDYIHSQGYTIDLGGGTLDYYLYEEEEAVVLVDTANKILHLISDNVGCMDEYIEGAINLHNAQIKNNVTDNYSVSKKQNNIYLIDL